MSTNNLADDINSKIKQDFGLKQFSVITTLLNLDKDLSNRVLRCIIYLAKGNLEKLKHYTECANRDYRDVIYWAEYFEGEDKTKPRRVRNFNKPFGKEEF